MSRSRLRPLFATGLGLFVGASLSGCYTYAPAEFSRLAQGSEVRARLTQDAAVRIEGALGRDASVLEGRVREIQGSSLLLTVPSTTRQVGFNFQQLSQSVEFDEGDAVLLEFKRLDRGRTLGLAAVAAAAVTALVLKTFGEEAGGDTTRPPTGGPSDARRLVPAFSIPLP
mgnify:CR=1 FL=1